MTIDLDLDFDYGAYTYAQYSNCNTNILEISETSFHKTILAEKPSLNFSRTATHRGYYTTCEQRTDTVYMQAVGGRVPNWDVEARWTLEWGGEEDSRSTGSVKGDVYDDNGNRIRVNVQQESNGRGQVDVSASHKDRGRK